eukprot:Gb_03739 [translate_table: standard]
MTEEAEKRFEKAMGKIFQSKLPSTATSSAGTPSPKENANTGKMTQLGQMSKGASSSRVSGRPLRLTGNNVKSTSTSTSSPAPVCRPWDRGDLLRRLATFKSMTWFGKPKVVGPVNCARRGWVNVDVDMITCEACGTRLSFSTPPSWTQQQVESAADLFSRKLYDGHKSLCPWKGNECEEALAHFPPTPVPALIESYRDRCDALLQLSALPIVSSSAIDQMKLSWTPQIDRLLSQPPPFLASVVSRNGVKNSGIELMGDESALAAAILYYQAQRLISLCGWEPRWLPYIVDCEDNSTMPAKDTFPAESSPRLPNGHGPSVLLCSRTGASEGTESSQSKSACPERRLDPASVVLDCSLCGASVGMWTFSTVNRPLQLINYSSIESQEVYKKQAEAGTRGISAASCVGGVSTSEGKGKEHLDDAGEAMASSCRKDSSNERVLDLSLTIAGGPPPTKQNVSVLLPMPFGTSQHKAGFHSSSEVGDWTTFMESHELQDRVQSTGQCDNSAHSRRENAGCTIVDREGIDTAGSSKRKRTEGGSEFCQGTPLSGKGKRSDFFNEADDNNRSKRRRNGPTGERYGQEHASSEFHGFSSVNAVDTCYHDRKENSMESVENVPQGSSKSDEGIEEGTGTNIATLSTGRIGVISVGMSSFPEISGTQTDVHGEVCGNDVSVNRAESRGGESEVLVGTGRSGQRGEAVSIGDKAGCVSLCEDSQHALLVTHASVELTSTKDSMVDGVSMEFRVGGDKSEVYEPTEVNEKQEKSNALIIEPDNTLVEKSVINRPAQAETAKTNSAVTSGSGRDLELRPWGKGMEFDPIRQHRHFCPWVTPHSIAGVPSSDTNTGLSGWQLTIDALDQCNAQELASASLRESESTSSRYKVDPVASVRKFFETPSAKKNKGSRVQSSSNN